MWTAVKSEVDRPEVNRVAKFSPVMALNPSSRCRTRRLQTLQRAVHLERRINRRCPLTHAQPAEIRKRATANEKKTGLAAKYSVSRQTIYAAPGH